MVQTESFSYSTECNVQLASNSKELLEFQVDITGTRPPLQMQSVFEVLEFYYPSQSKKKLFLKNEAGKLKTHFTVDI